MSWRLVQADGRPADVVAFEEAIVVFFLESADILGVPNSLAAIYGICFASPEPLSYTEVHERLNLSAGSISQGLKLLREMGALKVVTTKLDRREFFAPDIELRKMVLHYIENRLQKQLEAGRGRLQSIAKSVPKSRSGSIKELTARVKALQKWHDKARTLLPFVKTFLKLT